MRRIDRLFTCKQCGVEFIVTAAELQQMETAPAAISYNELCPGCRALNALTARGHGLVKWYDPRKGFGFIRNEDGRDVFLHISAATSKNLRFSPNQKVSYHLETSPKGLTAVDVMSEE